MFSFSLPPNQVVLAYDNALAARGWRPPPPMPMDSERGGFVSEDYFGFPELGGTAFCSDSGAVTISYTPAAGGGTYLKVRHSRQVAGSACAPRVNPMFLRQNQLKFPPLHAPQSMTQRRGGSSSGGDEASASARLFGPLDAPDIVTHYLKELDSAGWKTGTVATSGTVSIASVQTTGPDGRPWVGALTAIRVTPFEAAVVLQVNRASER